MASIYNIQCNILSYTSSLKAIISIHTLQLLTVLIDDMYDSIETEIEIIPNILSIYLNESFLDCSE